MDFFEREEKAQRNTKLLVTYFILGLTALMVTLYFAALIILSYVQLRYHVHLYSHHTPFSWWNGPLFAGVALVTLAIVAIGAASKTRELSQGGTAVASMMGARSIDANSGDPAERRLLDLVEEMALAAGLPVPQVFVMRGEPGINAFAAGHSTSDAVVCVSAGCLKYLTRDELQGVIGHEFSHILNGDMRLNLRLMGIIFGIVCLAVLGRILVQVGGGRNKNALPAFGVALLVVGSLGAFFGRLIQAAVSRQREFLADASSVQFTRNPAGITGALKKIGGLSYGSRLRGTHTAEVSHMFFGNGMPRTFLGLLDTHPSLEDRIRAIEPSFDGTFPAIALAEVAESPANPPPIAALPRTHLHYAVEMRDSFPPAAQTAAREPFGASALIYALLLSDDASLRQQQLQFLQQNTSTGIAQETERLLPEAAGVAARAKLPLVDLALPALGNLSPAQYEEFSAATGHLIESDGQIDLFEYVLQKITLRRLDSKFKGTRRPIVQYYSIVALAQPAAVLLSALAYAGQDDVASAQTAFAQGEASLKISSNASFSLLPREQCGLSDIDAALDKVAQSSPALKKNVLAACSETVAADGVIQETEAQLLRAVAEALDCPLPPFMQTPA